MDIQRRAAKLLIQNRKTLAIAESCTGGLLSNSLTNISGSSKFFYLGIVPYTNKFKTLLLNIPESLLKIKGAVSEEAALLMARNIRKLAKTSFGLTITGIAGPSGATKTKPVGLTFIALSSSKKSICQKFIFEGGRLSVKKQAAYAALNLLIENLD